MGLRDDWLDRGTLAQGPPSDVSPWPTSKVSALLPTPSTAGGRPPYSWEKRGFLEGLYAEACWKPDYCADRAFVLRGGMCACCASGAGPSSNGNWRLDRLVGRRTDSRWSSHSRRRFGLEDATAGAQHRHLVEPGLGPHLRQSHRRRSKDRCAHRPTGREVGGVARQQGTDLYLARRAQVERWLCVQW